MDEDTNQERQENELEALKVKFKLIFLNFILVFNFFVLLALEIKKGSLDSSKQIFLKVGYNTHYLSCHNTIVISLILKFHYFNCVASVG